MAYIVVEDRDNKIGLVAKVNEKIAQGWVPIGGVSVAITENYRYGVSYCQAMIRESAPPRAVEGKE